MSEAEPAKAIGHFQTTRKGERCDIHSYRFDSRLMAASKPVKERIGLPVWKMTAGIEIRGEIINWHQDASEFRAEIHIFRCFESDTNYSLLD